MRRWAWVTTAMVAMGGASGCTLLAAFDPLEPCAPGSSECADNRVCSEAGFCTAEARPTPDAGRPVDAGIADANAPIDANDPPEDAGRPDAGPPDAGEVDPLDAGDAPDVDSLDAGDPPDVFPLDAGDPPDVEPLDAGDPPDVFPVDAGDPPDVEPLDANDPPDAAPIVVWDTPPPALVDIAPGQTKAFTTRFSDAALDASNGGSFAAETRREGSANAFRNALTATYQLDLETPIEPDRWVLTIGLPAETDLDPAPNAPVSLTIGMYDGTVAPENFLGDHVVEISYVAAGTDAGLADAN